MFKQEKDWKPEVRHQVRGGSGVQSHLQQGQRAESEHAAFCQTGAEARLFDRTSCS